MSDHQRPMSHREDPVPYRLFGNADDVPDSQIVQRRRVQMALEDQEREAGRKLVGLFMALAMFSAGVAFGAFLLHVFARSL